MTAMVAAGISCHGFSSMDTSNTVASTISVGSASMLPWIFIHGYRKRDDVLVRKVVSFNVAMDFHPWIRLSQPDMSDPVLPRFNVAMDFHPWIRDSCAEDRYVPFLLQCCHGFSSMDTKIVKEVF